MPLQADSTTRSKSRFCENRQAYCAVRIPQHTNVAFTLPARTCPGSHLIRGPQKIFGEKYSHCFIFDCNQLPSLTERNTSFLLNLELVVVSLAAADGTNWELCSCHSKRHKTSGTGPVDPDQSNWTSRTRPAECVQNNQTRKKDFFAQPGVVQCVWLHRCRCTGQVEPVYLCQSGYIGLELVQFCWSG